MEVLCELRNPFCTPTTSEIDIHIAWANDSRCTSIDAPSAGVLRAWVDTAFPTTLPRLGRFTQLKEGCLLAPQVGSRAPVFSEWTMPVLPPPATSSHSYHVPSSGGNNTLGFARRRGVTLAAGLDLAIPPTSKDNSPLPRPHNR